MVRPNGLWWTPAATGATERGEVWPGRVGDKLDLAGLLTGSNDDLDATAGVRREAVDPGPDVVASHGGDGRTEVRLDVVH